jgi:hypothetical protein
MGRACVRNSGDKERNVDSPGWQKNGGGEIVNWSEKATEIVTCLFINAEMMEKSGRMTQ